MADPNFLEFRYYAFISYNSKDTKWGKRLQRKLEQYRMPATVCTEHGWERKPINPVFFAPTDIQPGGLNEELKNRLKTSKNLIVICSPNSAQSEWVGKEIEYFHELGRDENIHFFIVDGIPNSANPATECFNPVVKKLGLPEILGANIHEKIYRWSRLNLERAYVQLISKLLGVEFDSIWKRHRRQLIAKTVTWIIGILSIISVMFLIWKNNQPFETTVSLKEVSIHNPNLPPLQNAVITMYLETETKTDTILCDGESVKFTNIPHKHLNNDVKFTFSSDNFISLDTILKLTKDVILKISRDPEVYGNIRKKLWHSERVVPNANVLINGQWESTSDADGIVHITIPLELQKENYIINVPAWEIADTVFMPCGPDDVIVLDR